MMMVGRLLRGEAAPASLRGEMIQKTVARIALLSSVVAGLVLLPGVAQAAPASTETPGQGVFGGDAQWKEPEQAQSAASAASNSGGVDFTVEQQGGSGLRVSLDNGRFVEEGKGLAVVDEGGVTSESLPVNIRVPNGGPQVEIRHTLISETEAVFTTSESTLSAGGANDGELPAPSLMAWEGSVNECVSEAGVSGALAGAVAASLGGPAAAIPGAVLGMLSNGTIQALTSCAGLPYA